MRFDKDRFWSSPTCRWCGLPTTSPPPCHRPANVAVTKQEWCGSGRGCFLSEARTNLRLCVMHRHGSLGSGGRITRGGGGRQAIRQFSDRCTRRGSRQHQSTPGSQVRNHLCRRSHTQERGRQGSAAKEVFAKEKHMGISPLGPTNISPAPVSPNPITS